MMLFMFFHSPDFALATSVLVPLLLLWFLVIRGSKQDQFGRNLIVKLRTDKLKKLGVLDLLPDEKKRHLKTPSISTLTFYKKIFPVDELRARLKQIVEKNPFLLSRLVTIRNSDFDDLKNFLSSAGVCAVYPNTVCDEDESNYFRLVQDSSINSQLPYEELVRKVSKYDVSLGKDATDQDLPLFRVTLIEIEKDAQYCMMVSLCHTIADGFTFYKIYSMLDHRTPITSIVVNRVHAFSSEMAKNLNFGTSLWELPLVLCGSLYNRFLGPRMQARLYAVNAEQILIQKETYAKNNSSSNPSLDATSNNTNGANRPFLSTNDILTSWFFKFSKVELGFMIANFRNRHASLNNTHGGNYQGRILFVRPDMEEPEQVRSALRDFKPISGVTHTLAQVARMNIALVTNWATFYTDVEFTGCDVDIHLPVIDLSSVALRQGMVVFQASKSVTGVILWTRGIAPELFEREKIIMPII